MRTNNTSLLLSFLLTRTCLYSSNCLESIILTIENLTSNSAQPLNRRSIMTEVPVPPQHVNQPIYDFRHIEVGPRGYKVNVTKWGNVGSKRKLDEYAEQVGLHLAINHACISFESVLSVLRRSNGSKKKWILRMSRRPRKKLAR